MRNHPVLKVSSLIGAILIISVILSSCATATPAIPDSVLVQPLVAQTEVEMPGGMMTLPDGMGTDHPVLVFDFQIQSRLVVGAEYAACVEAGACEPVGETEYPLAPAGVNWHQAQAYCSYLGGRLPTEAELTRATGGNEDCSETGGSIIEQEGFGEWVYDWDDPDYYNDSLSSNPFGPLYGDLKVVLGLDLDAVSEAIGKYWVKLDEIKIDQGKLDEIKIDQGKLDEIKFDQVKLDEIKFDMYKFFADGSWQYTKEDWQYSIKFEEGKFYISAGSVDMDKSGPGQGSAFPRLGMLPDSANPLIGFRCVTEGAALSYAPICKATTAPKCSPPPEILEPISLQLESSEEVDPNLQILGANCPQGDQFAITLSHDLPSADGAEIKAGDKTCACKEIADYPGQLYCNCPSPGAGSKTEIKFCASPQEQTLISMSDLCPDGSIFDLQTGGCIGRPGATPIVYSLVDQGSSDGGSTCPTGPGLPVPQTGSLAVSLATVAEISEEVLPEADPWELFSLSDGSGMCPPGYAFNPDTGCCSPMSAGNYDCAPDEYFDAGSKRCLPVGWDGCGPCQKINVDGVCAYQDPSSFSGMRCETDPDKMERDDYGRPKEDPGGCPSGAYLDSDSGRCLETPDGCALGSYLDPKTGTCRPTSGVESPCPDGYTFNPKTGCCVPAPGTEESECPEGTEFDGAFCRSIMGGCPPTHYYDQKTDSCLLLEQVECPAGTSKSIIDKCIPDLPGDCPDGTEYYPTSGACPSGPPDPATCTGNKVFDTSTGFCRSGSSSGLGAQRSAGETSLGDIAVVKTWDESTPEIAESCVSGRDSCDWLPDLLISTGGTFRCLMLSTDKTFRSSNGLCLPDVDGEGNTEHFFTIEFEGGRIASISRISPDTIDPASAEAPPTEAVTFCYGVIFRPDGDTGKDSDDEDDWATPASGMPPDGSKCPGSIYIDAGALFGTENCTSLTTTVPICAAPSTGGSGPKKCSDVAVKEDCYKTTGCGWDGMSCLPCSSVPLGMCDIQPKCRLDIATNSCVPN